jgi:hypothetical protein
MSTCKDQGAASQDKMVTYQGKLAACQEKLAAGQEELKKKDLSARQDRLKNETSAKRGWPEQTQRKNSKHIKQLKGASWHWLNNRPIIFTQSSVVCCS